jgi:MarR family
MPPVEILNRTSEPDARPALTEQERCETLAHNRAPDHLSEGTGVPVDAEQQSKEFHAHDGGSTAAAPARSRRRATARRASNRRATARTRQSDTEARIIDFLTQHPGSTVGDLAKGLNLDPESVSTRLTHLAKTGEIKKTPHGSNTRSR